MTRIGKLAFGIGTRPIRTFIVKANDFSASHGILTFTSETQRATGGLFNFPIHVLLKSEWDFLVVTFNPCDLIFKVMHADKKVFSQVYANFSKDLSVVYVTQVGNF